VPGLPLSFLRHLLLPPPLNKILVKQ